ncbi:MAG: zinc ribbon domain-containing protein [Firmicutes bacterium]|nr:zinc ribbon domain-containing protein [Bacillota bacterium]
MFFIGIFGIQSKSEVIRTEQSVICPICGAYDRYDVIKTFNYFHVFFIPVWKWNYRYFLQTRCCQQTCSLEQQIGERIDRGEVVSLGKEHVHCSQGQGRICPNCRAGLDATYNYCPTCGERL